MKKSPISFVFLILLLCSCSNESYNERVYHENFGEQFIIGKWIEFAKNDTLSTFEFFDNGLWKKATTPYSVNYVQKGRYTIGSEREVYMRLLGSAHWPSIKDTVEDRRSSIGAFVLFLEDSLLVNNQEDYKTYWKKVNK